MDNNDQFVKGTVDKELKLQRTLGKSQPQHHSLGEYIHIHCAGYVTPFNAYCNAVRVDQGKGSSSYMNPPADFGKFYIVVHIRCVKLCTYDVYIMYM